MKLRMMLRERETGRESSVCVCGLIEGERLDWEQRGEVKATAFPKNDTVAAGAQPRLKPETKLG